MGVKEAQVYVDSQLIFDGIVDKGCANQVFDYACKIKVPANAHSQAACGYCSAVASVFKPTQQHDDTKKSREVRASVVEHRKTERRQDKEVSASKSEVFTQSAANPDADPSRSRSEMGSNSRPLPKPIRTSNPNNKPDVGLPADSVSASVAKKSHSSSSSQAPIHKASVTKSDKFELSQMEVATSSDHLRYSEGHQHSDEHGLGKSHGKKSTCGYCIALNAENLMQNISSECFICHTLQIVLGLVIGKQNTDVARWLPT